MLKGIRISLDKVRFQLPLHLAEAIKGRIAHHQVIRCQSAYETSQRWLHKEDTPHYKVKFRLYTFTWRLPNCRDSGKHAGVVRRHEKHQRCNKKRGVKLVRVIGLLERLLGLKLVTDDSAIVPSLRTSPSP